MAVKLQSFRHDESGYERPIQNWVCGRACDGAACSQGPSLRGRCTTTHACVPCLHGDRWTCNRPESLGGSCEHGPTAEGGCGHVLPPCRPTRSLRYRRTLTVRFVAALAAAASLVVLVGTLRQPVVAALFNPGRLSAAHAEYTTRCSSCHSTVNDSVEVAIFAASALFGSNSGMAFETACLGCHVQPDSSAFNPHGFATGYFRERLALLGLEEHLEEDATGARACSSCHAEHRGVDAELVPDGSTICATCHRVNTRDFEQAHASYQTFATGSPVRWSFDHATHRGTHFPKEGLAFACVECHNAGRSDIQMTVNRFEASCGNCHHHADEIARVAIPVFQLPGIDFETMADEGHGIGTWPSDAGIDLESGLTGATHLLLDEEGAAAAERLKEANVWLNDLIGSEEHLDDVERLAWSVKSALADIQVRGADALEERIGARSGRRVPARLRPQLEQWATALSRASRDWFPSLAADVDAYGSGGAVDLKEYDGYAVRESVEGAWAVDTREFVVRYLVAEHGDELVRSLFDWAAGNSKLPDLLPMLSEAGTAGACMRCHAGAVKTSRMLWGEGAVGAGLVTTAPNAVASAFDHGPHLAVSDCENCHKPSGSRDHPFVPTATSTCTPCHGRNTTATMKCASCHRYHNEMPPYVAHPDSGGTAGALALNRTIGSRSLR